MPEPARLRVVGDDPPASEWLPDAPGPFAVPGPSPVDEPAAVAEGAFAWMPAPAAPVRSAAVLPERRRTRIGRRVARPLATALGVLALAAGAFVGLGAVTGEGERESIDYVSAPSDAAGGKPAAASKARRTSSRGRTASPARKRSDRRRRSRRTRRVGAPPAADRPGSGVAPSGAAPAPTAPRVVTRTAPATPVRRPAAPPPEPAATKPKAPAQPQQSQPQADPVGRDPSLVP